MQQKIQIFIIFFLIFSFSAFGQNDPFEECDAGATAGVPQFSGIETISYDSETDMFSPDISELAVDLSSIGQSGFANYAFVVTGPPEFQGKRPIVGVTYDGVWNFGRTDNEPRPFGEYCFTGFGYDQADMDAITGNFIARGVLNQCSPPGSECVQGGEELDEILDCLVNLEESTCVDDPDSPTVYDIDTVLFILRDQISILLNYTPCVMVSENTYCVEYIDAANDTTVVEPGDTTVTIAISEFGFLGFEGIYPNPVVNEATVVFNAGEHDFVNVEIYNLTGQRIYGDGYLAEPGKNEYRIDVSNWNQGYYFIKLDDGKEVITKRMIVNH